MDSNLEPKNEYFQKKEEKEGAAKAAQRKKMIKKTAWAFLGVVVLVLVAWKGYAYFKKAAEEENKPPPGQYFEAQSQDHIEIGASHPAYNSNPPTAGWHYAQPAQSGIYDKPFPDEQIVHNLEHGHVWIAYKPDLPAAQIELLADIAKDYGSKIIMAPREANDTPIALVAWEYLLKMETVDEVAVNEFIEAQRGAGPENILDYGFKDFREGK